jgi:hypothetical protein
MSFTYLCNISTREQLIEIFKDIEVRECTVKEIFHLRRYLK